MYVCMHVCFFSYFCLCFKALFKAFFRSGGSSLGLLSCMPSAWSMLEGCVYEEEGKAAAAFFLVSVPLNSFDWYTDSSVTSLHTYIHVIAFHTVVFEIHTYTHTVHTYSTYLCRHGNHVAMMSTSVSTYVCRTFAHSKSLWSVNLPRTFAPT